MQVPYTAGSIAVEVLSGEVLGCNPDREADVNLLFEVWSDGRIGLDTAIEYLKGWRNEVLPAAIIDLGVTSVSAETEANN